MCPADIRPVDLPAAETFPLEVLLTRLDPAVPVPGYSHAGDAGADLVTTRDLVLGPGERAVVGTGIAVALPAGYAGFVHPRSGLAARAGLGIVNAPGTIDAGYRGELRVCLVNHDLREPVVLRRMDRVAQLVVQRVEHVAFREVTTLPESSRGVCGYGSTGTRAFSPTARGFTTPRGFSAGGTTPQGEC
ncbi:MAG: dUTP diphosphatase [Pseudonocardiaceae bacterium]